MLVGLGGRTRNAHALALVERGMLMGILAVAKIGLLVKDDALVLPERTLLDQLVVQPGVDGVVIGTREAEDLEGKVLAGLERSRAIIVPHLEQDGVVHRRIGDDSDGSVVLGSASQHGGTTDVDMLDGVLIVDVGLGNGRLEGVEVHDHHVDHADTVVFGILHVGGKVAARKQATMHLGMQGLHAAIHHLGKTRKLVDCNDGNARLLKHLGSATRAHDLDAKLIDEGTREILDARFIGE